STLKKEFESTSDSLFNTYLSSTQFKNIIENICAKCMSNTSFMDNFFRQLQINSMISTEINNKVPTSIDTEIKNRLPDAIEKKLEQKVPKYVKEAVDKIISEC